MIKKKYYRIVSVLMLVIILFQSISPSIYKCYATFEETDNSVVSDSQEDENTLSEGLEDDKLIEEEVSENINKNESFSENTSDENQNKTFTNEEDIIQDETEEQSENNNEEKIENTEELNIEISEFSNTDIMVGSGDFYIGNEAEFRNAIANQSDVIHVRQSIDFSSPLIINYPVTISAESDDNALRYAGGGTFITVQNGGSLTLDRMVVDTNSAGTSGVTAINIENGGNVTFVSSSIVDGGLGNTGILVNSGANLLLWSSEIVRCGVGINLQGNGHVTFGTQDGRRNHFYWNKTAFLIDNFNGNCEFNQSTIVMHDNTDYAIHIANSSGNINISNGDYFNNTYGVRTQNGQATISGGAFHSNGWALWCGANMNLTGGDIYSNYYGVLTDESGNGKFTMTGGSIHDNTAHAIQHQKTNDGGCTILGGTISGDIYLAKNDNYVNTNSDYPSFTVTPSSYYFKRKLVKTTNNNTANSEIGNVTLTPKDQWYKYVDNEYIVLWQNGKIIVRCYDSDIPNGNVMINGAKYTDMLFIKDATFNILDANGNVIQTVKTDGNGYAESKELPANKTYLVKQVGVPDNYNMNNNVITATFVDKNYTANFPVEHKKGNLSIEKVDSDDENIKLKDVTFNLYVNEVDKPYSNGDFIGTYKTDEKGKIEVNNIWTGKYYFVENETLKTYNLDTTHNHVVIKDKDTTISVVKNEKKKDKIKVTIKDKDTDIPLKDITLVILDEDRSIIEEITTDENGEATSADLPIDKKYIVIQKDTLDNYINNDEEIEVDFIKEFGYEDEKVYQINISNEHKKGNIELEKVDLDTRENLEGFEFELYVQDIDNPFEKDQLMGTFTTNPEGKIVIEKLWTGKYYFKEKTNDANQYYQLIDKNIDVTIEENKDTKFVVENEKQKGQIEISKKVSKDYSEITKLDGGALLEGAVFEIIDEEDRVVDTITTDENGYAISNRLPIDHVYTIREKLSPEYYLVDDREETIEFSKNGEVVSLEWENEAVSVGLEVEQTGVKETQIGDTIRYDFTMLKNKSNVEINEFCLEDEIPVKYILLQKLYTGKYNYEHDYTVWYKLENGEWKQYSNENSNDGTYNTLKNNCIDFSKIDGNITNIKLEFGTVENDFEAVEETPFIFVKVNDSLKNEDKWENCVKLIGKYVSNRNNEMELEDSAIIETTVYDKKLSLSDKVARDSLSLKGKFNRGILPRTGY